MSPAASASLAPVEASQRDLLAAAVYADGSDPGPWLPTVDGSPNVASYDVADRLLAAGAIPRGRVVEEWGVETQWGIEWGASVGPTHHYEYTAQTVWGHASGRPVHRRLRTIFDQVLSASEVVDPSDMTGGRP